MKQNVLGASRRDLDRAEKRGARRTAPHVLADAQVKYDSALRILEGNRREPAAYGDAVARSVEASQKLDQVMTSIETTGTTEAAASQMYDQKQQLASAQTSLAQSQAQVQVEQSSVAALTEKNAKYADKEALNQSIETAKQEFRPEEAEVLRDGNKIVLRLKSMKFSSSRAELTSSSIETLQKVKDMIAAVPAPKIAVQGHTDNVGSAAKNQDLSTQRAEAVKKFLVAEKAAPEDKIQAEGFGFQRPLASNQSASGRAVNRRVDIIIESGVPL